MRPIGRTALQSLSGSPFRQSAMAEPQTLEIVGGDHLRDYRKRGASGAVRHQRFCGTCGSALFTHGDGADAPWGHPLGSIRQQAQLRPTRQVWCESAVDFLAEIPALPGSRAE